MDGWLQFREVNTENCPRQILKEKCWFLLQQKINLVRNWVLIDNPFLRKNKSSEKDNGISIDFNNRFLYLSTRAALDSSYVQELDGILREARAIEHHLKQKREKLKQRFAVIANSLQS